jgi:serine/threonine protein kinase
VLIGADGYIKLTDFGLSKNNILGDYDTFSVCGTPEYLAPEVVRKEGHGKAVDWWCLGSIIYELVHGLPPFYTKNRSELFDRIKNSEPYMNKNWSKNMRDLFAKLFTKNPEERMKFVPALKEHPWFEGVSWQDLLARTIKPPFTPFLAGESDVANFDKEFTTCSIESHASSYADTNKFTGFSYEKKSPDHHMELEEELNRSDSDGEIVFTSEEIQMQA